MPNQLTRRDPQGLGAALLKNLEKNGRSVVLGQAVCTPRPETLTDGSRELYYRAESVRVVPSDNGIFCWGRGENGPAQIGYWTDGTRVECHHRHPGDSFIHEVYCGSTNDRLAYVTKAIELALKDARAMSLPQEAL